MFSIFKLILFVICNYSFGFAVLSQILKINSVILLLPLSFTLGIGTYIFLVHTLAYLVGPQLSSLLSLFIQILTAIILVTIKRKNLNLLITEINKKQFALIISIALVICILTFFGISKYGVFDRESHMPTAKTMFHNNVYPPRDPFRPDYVLLYHYGGDILGGAINFLTDLEISRSFEIVSTCFSGITFLSFFALAWILTRSFNLSLIGGFCTYFSGGLMWLDAILRYLTKNFPPGESNWTFLQTYLNFGFHGSIVNPPSILTFSSTSVTGNPLLILCFILFWKMLETNSIKKFIIFFSILLPLLVTLYLTTDWLYAAFWAGVILFLPFIWILISKKVLVPIIIFLILSLISVKTIGNALFLQDELQNLGRTNVLDIGIKEKLFIVACWGRISTSIMNYQWVSCFSWDFLCEFGLSLILLPLAIIYLFKTKNLFAVLLSLCALGTMPLPTIIDFKMFPVDLVRLFAFGNTMLVLLITCSIGTLFKKIFENKLLLFTYILCFILSPFSQLISAVIFTPRVFTDKNFIRSISNSSKNFRSINDFKNYLGEFHNYITLKKHITQIAYKQELDYLKNHSKSKDVALCNLFFVPGFAGVYSFIPSGEYIFWDQLYSRFNSIFQTSFNTLDLHILKELNIKWVLISESFKNQLPEETKELLNNNDLFQLAFTGNQIPHLGKEKTEIYQIKNLDEILKTYNRKTAWVLINKNGQVLELSNLMLNTVSMFPTKNESLLYLKDLYNSNPKLKKELVTAQPVIIKDIENQIKNSNLQITLNKKF